MKTTMKIAVIAMMGMSLGVNAQKVISLEGENDPNFVNKSGKIGLGLTNPSFNLDVSSSRANIRLRNTNPSNWSFLRIQGSGSKLWDIAQYGDNDFLEFRPNGTTATVIFRQNGNVGIGTTNPKGKLDVNGGYFSKGREVMVSDGLSSYLKTAGNIYFENSNSVLATILNNGNVGIGTTSPSAKLSVNGGIQKLTDWNGVDGRWDNLIKYGHKNDLEHSGSRKNRWHGIDATITAGGAASNKMKFRVYSGTNADLAPKDVMTLNGLGNVAIHGKLESKEVKVTNTPTADFVFEKDYNLPTLKSIEKYIKEKKHLPEIASAKEMEKNGVNVGNFQIQLLQKIEELTLYTIDQEKKLKTQRENFEQQQEEINSQKEEIEELKKQNSEIKELKALVQKLLKDKN